MATSPSSATEVVLDASALIRALVDLDPKAQRWLDRTAAEDVFAAWPAHLYVEVGHVLVRFVRVGRIDARRAGRAFDQIRRMPATVGAPEAIEDAMAVALERRLTVYDAAYVVLAEALDAPLVTADRRLAEATEQAILLPG